MSRETVCALLAVGAATLAGIGIGLVFVAILSVWWVL
jgi:hypothetical protein